MRRLLSGVLVLMLSPCAPTGSAGTSTIAPFGPTPVQVPAGQSMTDPNHHSIRLLGYQRGSSSRAGKQCVRVSLALTNTATADWLTPLNQIQLSDARGFVYYRSDDCGTNTMLQTLGPGESASAILYFEVLDNATVDLSWTPKIGDPGFSTPLR